ncbi:dodecin family protein [Iningainema tapete]|uniref:Dodecin domain-containing protein n=1 Tax=Iningainema tapete BLCC-T55 TaxID=2748662 RepID=A0A8J7C605_9CYAN|nr:dodecin family protein [Iningainema tapete]MBD2773714.1 dodecin domain-containing protein [Iningainema tapete BLCC-T55]
MLRLLRLWHIAEKSFDDAVKQGLAEAARTLHGISGLEITNWTADVENNQIVRYKVTEESTQNSELRMSAIFKGYMRTYR